MKLYAGWYVVGLRLDRVLAIVAGPVQSRERADGLLATFRPVAESVWTVQPGDTFHVAWLAFPKPLPGAANAHLWLQPEFQEYEA